MRHESSPYLKLPRKPSHVRLVIVAVVFWWLLAAHGIWPQPQNGQSCILGSPRGSDNPSIRPYRLFFYSGDRHEPPHVHVERDDATAKFWLDPVRLANSRRFAGVDLRDIERRTSDNADDLLRAWNEFFSH